MKNILSYSYYPGCSLHASGKEYDESTRGLFKALNIGLTEVPDWMCCGATPAHNVDELLSLSLCAKNLELSEQVEGDLAVACAACFSRLKTAQHKLADHPETRKQVEYALDAPLAVAKPVKHLLEILAKDKSHFDIMTDFAMFGAVIFETLAVTTIFVFRRRLPDAERPYRCPGYPVVPLLYLILPMLILGNMFWSQQLEALTGVGFIALGAGVYYWYFGRNRATSV